MDQVISIDVFLKNLLNEGFVFFDLPMSEDLRRKILSLKFDHYSYAKGEDASLQLELLPEELDLDIRNYLSQINILKELITPLRFSAHKFQVGEEMDLHTDTAVKGDYQVLLWVCESNEFLGRDFIYGIKEDQKTTTEMIKPKTGLICVQDTTSKKFIHGVSKLESNINITTICGSLFN